MARFDRNRAKELLLEAGQMNPGGWVDHSFNVAHAAETIAAADPDLDPDQSYAFGCIHDIGRRFGVTDMRHVYDGFVFLEDQGFRSAARICLTHSFPLKNADVASGQWDCTEAELKFVREFLDRCRYTNYDRLIQLCDALALPSGFCLIEKRLVDVALRRGVNELTIKKWEAFFELQRFFQARIKKSVYDLLPNVIETTFGTDL